MNIYVGNLPYSVTEEKLQQMFQRFGEVQSVKLITDRETGRSRGFGFVEMGNAEADAAIKALNNSDLEGKKLKVNQSNPQKSSRPARRRW